MTRSELNAILNRPLDRERTIDETVDGFMKCWRERAFEDALGFCQRSWIDGVYNKAIDPPKGSGLKKSPFDQTPLSWLKAAYRYRFLDSWDIQRHELALKHPDEPPLNPKVIIDVKVRIDFTERTLRKKAVQSKKKNKQRRSPEYIVRNRVSILAIRCVREAGVQKLNPAGEWGVNPTSMFREEVLE